MKNRFVIALVALIVSGMTMAQDLKPVIGTGQPAPEMKQQKAAGDWKIQFSTTVTPAFTSPAGITSDGKDFYTVSVAKPMIYRVGFDNKLKDSVSISGLSKSSVTSAYAVGVAPMPEPSPMRLMQTTVTEASMSRWSIMASSSSPVRANC